MRPRLRAAFVVMVGLAACKRPPEVASPAPPAPEPAPVAEPAPVPAPEPYVASGVPSSTSMPWDVEGRMQVHFDFATRIVTHVVHGEVDEAKKAARTLAEMDTPSDMPVAWRSGFVRFRLGASEIAAEDDLLMLGVGAAAMGMRCAECHEEGRGPNIEIPSVLAVAELPDEEMSAHVKAAYLLWNGVYLPSEEVYDAGTKILATSMGEGALEQLIGSEVPPRVQELWTTHDIVARAQKATDARSRAEAYGRFLGVCHTCHSEVGVTLPSAAPHP